MLAQIIAGTPLWVPVVFIVLLAYGILQSRTRNLNTVQVLMLPAIMTILSIGGVLTSFHTSPPAMAAWLVGFGLAVALNQLVRAPAGVTFDPATHRFRLPGTWTPLALMMAIFFAKYVVGAMSAMRPDVVGTFEFAAFMSLVFGFLSGTFFARFLKTWSARRLSGSLATPAWRAAP